MYARVRNDNDTVLWMSGHDFPQGCHYALEETSIVFRSDETGYTVCSVLLDDQQTTATVVGNCPSMWVGESLEADGEWIQHKRHGYQFQAESITCIAPTSIPLSIRLSFS